MQFQSKRFFIFIFCFLCFVGMIYVSFVLLQGRKEYQEYVPDFIHQFEVRNEHERISESGEQNWKNLIVSGNKELTLSCVLPEDTPKLARLNLKILYSSIQVFLNDELFYSHGTERQKAGLSLAAGVHKIKLPKDYHGKTLEIKIVPVADFKLSYLVQHISLGENHNISIFILRQNLFAFMASMFLIIFGIIIMLIFIIMLFRMKPDTFGIAYLAVFTFCIGLWGLCSIDFIQIYNDNIILNHYIEYFAFYLIFPNWIFVISYLKKSNVYAVWLKRLKIVFGIFLLTVVVAQIFNIASYDKFLSTYHVLALLSSVICLIVLGYDFKNQPAHEKLLFIGSGATIIGAVSQGILYNVVKFFKLSLPLEYSHVSWLYIILLLIVFTFFSSYAMKYSKSIISKRELQLLQKMAYEDCLTGLGNRQSGIIQLLDYEKQRRQYYLIVFDLNNLKTANDEFGHAKGDQMLINFAACLNLAFPENATKLRIGGDEFLVIVPTADLSIINQSINNLRSEMQNVQARMEDPISIEVAYGIASTTELSTFDYELILSAADKRMYINKKMVKDHIETQLEITVS